MIMDDKPFIVSSHDTKIDTDYADWLTDIKSRYRSAQVKAAVKVNAEKLLFNWQLGRDLVIKKAEERWGAGVVEQISLDHQKEFQKEKGFSTSNLWFMKRWYLFYTQNVEFEKLDQLGRELQLIDSQFVKNLTNLVEFFHCLLRLFRGDINHPRQKSVSRRNLFKQNPVFQMFGF